MRLALALAAVVAVAGQAEAGTELYIYDVLHRPTYATSYNRVMSDARGAARWFSDARVAGEATTSPARTLSVAGKTEDLFKLCRPHRCDAGTLAVLFSDEGERAVAAYYDMSKVVFFGNPTSAERATLNEEARQGI